jgi:glycine C-acetyltransferase/8-amino-7-oxononanoate synthase
MADLFTELMGYPQRPLSSIFPHVIGENNEALQAADHLMELGHLAPAIRYPTVPKGTARLRLTITAANSEEQVRSLAHALHTLKS